MAKILLVDDQPDVLKMLESLLKKRGHETTSAKDAFAAMEFLKAKAFQLVITDAKMPGGPSGFELVSTIRKDAKLKNLLFVMLTGRNEKKDVAHAIEVGVDGYIVKPFDPEMFLKKIDEVLKLQFHGNSNQRELALNEVTFLDSAAQIVALSGSGLKFQSSHALTVGEMVKVHLPFLQIAELLEVHVEVRHCLQVDGKKIFLILGQFKELSPEAAQALNSWLEQRFNSKAA